MKDTLALILGGGRGTRLYPLTLHRSKPAVPIAGKYRLIDVPISNCLNSGLNRIYVLTQFLSVSLHRHISHTYKFDAFDNGFVEILAAQQTNEAADWYQGTADAVRQNIRYIEDEKPQKLLILSGDQLYRTDFRHLGRTHQQTSADVTIAVFPVPAEATSEFGLVRVDESGRVNGFVEKPKTPGQLEAFATPFSWLERRGFKDHKRPYLASMGIYLFNWETLFNLLNAPPPATDFGKEVFPRSLASHRVQAHLFDGYWEDLGTIKAYHQASLALTGDQPPFDFHSPEGFIYTRMRFLPASRVSSAELDQCLISDGCIIHAGAKIKRCVVGLRSQIGRSVSVRDTVLNGADRYETDAERAENSRRGIPNMGIGDGSIIEHAILDKDFRIGRGVKILNSRNVQEEDGPNYVIREGIVVIPKGVFVPDGSEI
jgi:glucose-1-phosphate adenylyltransferase